MKITRRQLRRIIKEEKRKLHESKKISYRGLRRMIREQLGGGNDSGASLDRIEINYDSGGMNFHHPTAELPHGGYIERQPGWPDDGSDPYDFDSDIYSPAERKFFANFVQDLANETGATAIWDAETGEEQSIDEFVAQELSGGAATPAFDAAKEAEALGAGETFRRDNVWDSSTRKWTKRN